MSVTYEELFYEFPTIRLRNFHQQDIDNITFIQTDSETGQWTCCWEASHPLNGGGRVAIPVAFEVFGRLREENIISMDPAGDDREEEKWFAHWYLEALGQGQGHQATWNQIQQAIIQIAGCAPVPLNTATVLHHDDHSERMALAFSWYLGMDLPCVYVESLEDKNSVCVSCYQTNLLTYIPSYSSTVNLHTLILMDIHTQPMN
jgi:hypothetical protein